MLRGAQIMLWALVIADCVAFMPASPSARDPVLQVRIAVGSQPSVPTMHDGVSQGFGHADVIRHSTMPFSTPATTSGGTHLIEKQVIAFSVLFHIFRFLLHTCTGC